MLTWEKYVESFRFTAEPYLGKTGRGGKDLGRYVENFSVANTLNFFLANQVREHGKRKDGELVNGAKYMINKTLSWVFSIERNNLVISIFEGEEAVDLYYLNAAELLTVGQNLEKVMDKEVRALSEDFSDLSRASAFDMLSPRHLFITEKQRTWYDKCKFDCIEKLKEKLEVGQILSNKLLDSVIAPEIEALLFSINSEPNTLPALRNLSVISFREELVAGLGFTKTLSFKGKLAKAILKDEALLSENHYIYRHPKYKSELIPRITLSRNAMTTVPSFLVWSTAPEFYDHLGKPSEGEAQEATLDI